MGTEGINLKYMSRKKNHLGLQFEGKAKGVNKPCTIKIESQFSVLRNNPFILAGGK